MHSNLDRIWTDAQRSTAAEDGWQLVLVVDSGRPISTAYLEVFDAGPKFSNRHAALAHVIDQARRGSKLCIAALSACSASRMKGTRK